MQPIGFHAGHLRYLAATGDQFGQARQQAGVVPDERVRRTVCDDLSVERVGLGEPTSGTGKIPDLAWNDDCEW